MTDADLVGLASWAGAALALLAFLESLAVVGIMVPATPALLLAGGLIGGGVLRPAEVVPWVFAGAWGGFQLSYAVGRRVGPAIWRLRPLARRRRAVAQARWLLRRWGGLALIFGRLLAGPLQSLLPLAAGAAGMGRRRFLLVNLLSSALWTVALLAPGYLAGRGLRLFDWDDTQLAALVPFGLAGAVIAFAVAVAFVARRRVSAGKRGIVD